jgi:hypothetical protein
MTTNTDPKKCDNKDKWQCPNFRTKDGDMDMEYEHYECKVCGQYGWLDYEEMK